ARDKHGANPLHTAVARGGFWLARLLSDRPEALASRDAEGRTPLHRAVEKGDLDLAALLVERGADPLVEDSAGERPLAWLARRCAALLEERRDRPASVSDHACLRHALLRSAALFQASAEGQESAVELLLAKGAAPGELHGFLPDLGARATALHAAAWGGHRPVLVRLLRAGARPDAPDANGWTALHTAAWRGNFLEAEALLQAGARRDVRTRSGATPLELARAQENDALVRLLQRGR
ncbi:MAG TPA: ankyrin repeat domain-containing protein, partial [Myxococcota bacterium]|nr:ankyrin repeat domain-containing protein [Myxococcota bacterium]